MPKLTIGDLKKIQERHRQSRTLRKGKGRAKITVHMGTCGIAAGARKVMSALLDEIARLEVDDVIVTTSGCAGLCSREPMATVQLMGKPPVKYVDLDEEKIRRIMKDHVLGGEIVSDHALGVGSETTH